MNTMLLGSRIIFKGGLRQFRSNSKQKTSFGPTVQSLTRSEPSAMDTAAWWSGLPGSGSGKSTLTQPLERHLFNCQMHVYVLDGDNVRHGLNSNLEFLPDYRIENIQQVAEVAKYNGRCRLDRDHIIHFSLSLRLCACSENSLKCRHWVR